VLYNLWTYSTAPVLTNSARISAFLQASDQRGDDLAERLADDATTFCICTHCSPDHVRRFLKRMKESDNDNCDSSGSSSKRLRSSTEEIFNFREHRLFCGEECQVIRPQMNLTRCRTADRGGQISFKESVIRHAQRSNNWGNYVSLR